MSCITNRPLPIKQINRPIRTLNYGANIYDYFNDLVPATPPDVDRTYHGMQKARVQNQAIWDPIISFTGTPGMCYFLGFGVRNISVDNRVFGIRVVVDGSTVYSHDRVSVQGSSQFGMALIGTLFTANNALKTGASGVCPWERTFFVYGYVENLTDLSLVVARRVMMTL